MVIRKKIVFFLPNLDGGGAEKVALYLAREFSLKNFDVEFLLLKNSGEYFESARNQFVITSLREGSFICKVVQLFSFLKKINNAIVFSFLPLPNMFLGAYSFFNRRKLVLVGSERSDKSFEFPSYNKVVKFFIINVAQFLYNRLDGIVCISDEIASGLVAKNRVDSKKISVIYNPILQKYEGSSVDFQNSEPKWPVNALRFLSVGRLSGEKNHKLQLEFIKKLSSQYDCYLIIVGKGPLLQKLTTEIEELGLTNHVGLYGFVKDLSSFYESTQFFLHTAKFEGFGNVILEALSFGKNVIATSTSGANQILKKGEFGFLAEEFSADALLRCFYRAQIYPISSDKLKSRVNSFSLERCVLEHIEFFGRIETDKI